MRYTEVVVGPAAWSSLPSRDGWWSGQQAVPGLPPALWRALHEAKSSSLESPQSCSPSHNFKRSTHSPVTAHWNSVSALQQSFSSVRSSQSAVPSHNLDSG